MTKVSFFSEMVARKVAETISSAQLQNVVLEHLD